MSDVGISLTAAILNTDQVQDVLNKLSGEQARTAYAQALNDAGFQVRRAMQAEMRSQFDRVTPYIERSQRVKMATADKLSVTIEPADIHGKGVDPQKILQAQTFGGRRRDKRSEIAFRRAGLLPSGYQCVIPLKPYPGSEDGRGNIRGSFITQLLSYFQAFGEQGFRANMSDARKRRLHNQKDIGYIATKKVFKTTMGRRYFVSHGGMRDGSASHLEPGIWASSGLHGVEVRPVLIFTKAGSYESRISMERVAEAADVQNYLDKRVRYRIREIAGE